MQLFVHYFLHFAFPLAVAWIFFKKDWIKVYLIFLATMMVDLDHIFADPVFDPNRCSIAFHFLHSYPAIAVYTFFLFLRGIVRIVGLGLLFHMATDFLDCLFMFGKCPDCYVEAPAYRLLQFVEQLF